MVWKTEQDLTPEILFLAQLAIMMVAPTTTDVSNHTYWAYVLHPPLNRPTTWQDLIVSVYVNDSI